MRGKNGFGENQGRKQIRSEEKIGVWSRGLHWEMRDLVRMRELEAY